MQTKRLFLHLWCNKGKNKCFFAILWCNISANFVSFGFFAKKNVKNRHKNAFLDTKTYAVIPKCRAEKKDCRIKYGNDENGKENKKLQSEKLFLFGVELVLRNNAVVEERFPFAQFVRFGCIRCCRWWWCY